MGLMGVNEPANGSSASASASEPSRRSAGRVVQPVGVFHEGFGVQLGCGGGEGFGQHLEPTDKPRTPCGIEDRAMAIGEVGCPPGHAPHSKRLGWFNHDPQRPAESALVRTRRSLAT